MGEIIAWNMLSWLKLVIKLLLLHLFYIIVSVMHGHTNIKFNACLISILWDTMMTAASGPKHIGDL